MVKTTIKETTEKFDKDGNLIEKVTREEISEDDSDFVPAPINYCISYPEKWNPGEPYCECSSIEDFKKKTIEAASHVL